MRQPHRGGRYLIRGCFATTLGVMWLISAKGILTISPALWLAVFSMAFGVETVGVALLRERYRRSLR